MKTLRTFWEKYPDSRSQLEAWYHDARRASWKTPAEIKEIYRNVSIIGNNRAVFNIKGNKYRLVVAIQYRFGIVYVRFVGTHEEYDKIDSETI